VLRPLKETFDPADYPNLLVGLASADDAAVYRIDDETALVTTLDFFPPVVDDPFQYGAIAAANALSDIYAMGARPLYALNLVAFPENLDIEILSEIMRGGAEMVARAGAVIAGGHSIIDHEPKYGLAVTGTVQPDQIFTKGGARPGDLLVLTKPLGTGVVTTALRSQAASEAHIAEAVESMLLLNDVAASAARQVVASAVTDVTGFGLLGHAHEMAHLGAVDLAIDLQSLEWLSGAKEYAASGHFPGGAHRNRDYFQQWIDFDKVISDRDQMLLWSPETSGGLLATITAAKLSQFESLLDRFVVIGTVHEGTGRVSVRGKDVRLPG